MATIEDIKQRLKQEGYDQRAVADGGPCLTMQIRGLIRAAGTDTQPAEKIDDGRRGQSLRMDIPKKRYLHLHLEGNLAGQTRLNRP